jgi:hypothetical protein
MFRIKVTHETYQDMIKRYKEGKFINVWLFNYWT